MRSIFFIDKETAVRIIQARAGPRRKALPLKSYFLDLISDFRVYTKLETLSFSKAGHYFFVFTVLTFDHFE